MQKVADSRRITAQSEAATNEKRLDKRNPRYCTNVQLAEAGVEHITGSSDKTAYEPERAAFLRAISAVCGPNFAEIAAVWPSLPDVLKAEILAMVRATGGNG